MEGIQILRDAEKNLNWSLSLAIGNGSYGTVYKCSPLSSGGIDLTGGVSTNTLACKVMNKAKRGRNNGATEMFNNEVAVHSKLDHKNVVKFHYSFTNTHQMFIFLEFCENKTLKDFVDLRQPQACTEMQARYFIFNIMTGVEYLHQYLIIHRDLKSENILLSKDFAVKIGDFGISGKLKYAGQRQFWKAGSLVFMAPEMLSPNLRRNGYSENVDIYACGIILFQLLNGRLPFTSSIKIPERARNEITRQILSGKPVTPMSYQVDKIGQSLIMRMIEHLPSKRCSISEFFDSEFIKHKFIPAGLPSSWRSSGHYIRAASMEILVGRLKFKLEELLKVTNIADDIHDNTDLPHCFVSKWTVYPSSCGGAAGVEISNNGICVNFNDGSSLEMPIYPNVEAEKLAYVDENGNETMFALSEVPFNLEEKLEKLNKIRYKRFSQLTSLGCGIQGGINPRNNSLAKKRDGRVSLFGVYRSSDIPIGFLLTDSTLQLVRNYDAVDRHRKIIFSPNSMTVIDPKSNVPVSTFNYDSLKANGFSLKIRADIAFGLKTLCQNISHI